MTREELEAIRARAEAAPPGPWRWDIQDGSNSTDPGYSIDPVADLLGPDAPEPDDRDPDLDSRGVLLRLNTYWWSDGRGRYDWVHQPALGIGDAETLAMRRAMLALIEHARDDVPALLAEVERLREALDHHAALRR